MAGNGKVYDTNPSGSHSQGKAARDTGASRGERTNTKSEPTRMAKSIGTPKDKGVNR